MTAHKGKSVLLCHREAPGADFPLHAAAVKHQCVFGNQRGVFFQPGGAAVGVDCQQNQVALGNGLFIQLAMHRARQHGKGQHGLVSLNRVNGVPFQRIGPGKGTADQAETQNTNIHTRTSRIFCTFRLSSSNWGGVRDWAPSHRAQAGLLCTSTMMPSAPAAVAA